MFTEGATVWFELSSLSQLFAVFMCVRVFVPATCILVKLKYVCVLPRLQYKPHCVSVLTPPLLALLCEVQSPCYFLPFLSSQRSESLADRGWTEGEKQNKQEKRQADE